MKRFFLSIYITFFAVFFCSAKSIPGWLKNPEKEFPEEKYIYAMGKGNSEKSAQNSALANISLYFDVKTDIVMRSVKELGEFQIDEKTHSVDSESYFQINDISSSAEFFLVKFTESYYDKKNRYIFNSCVYRQNRSFSNLFFENRRPFKFCQGIKVICKIRNRTFLCFANAS